MTQPDDSKLMKNPHPLTFKEEVLNALLHGAMIVILLAVFPFLLIRSYEQSGLEYALSISVYVYCLLVMFGNSTLYHSMPYNTPWKTVTRKLDHISIALAIAGTYTPVCVSLNNPMATLMLAIEWILAISVICLKVFAKKSYPVLSNTIYLLMGWMVIFFLPELFQRLGWPFFIWMLAGGLLYTVGVYFYSIHKKYYHVIWHICIDLAFTCQFLAIILYL